MDAIMMALAQIFWQFLAVVCVIGLIIMLIVLVCEATILIEQDKSANKK